MIGKTCSETQSGIDGWTQPPCHRTKPFHAIAPQTHTNSMTQTHPAIDLILLEWTRDALDWNNFKWLLPFFFLFWTVVTFFSTFLYSYSPHLYTFDIRNIINFRSQRIIKRKRNQGIRIRKILLYSHKYIDLRDGILKLTTININHEG